MSATTAGAPARETGARQAPAPSPASGEPWTAFVTARTPQAYFRGWLEVVCARFPEVRAAALLVQGDAGASLLPIAVWPSADADLSRLTPTLQRAVGERRGLIDHVTQPPPAQDGEKPAPFVPVSRIGYPVLMGDRVAGAVVLEMLPNPARATELLRHLHWGLGWVLEALQRRDTEQATTRSARILSVMESVATALRPGKLHEILFEVANDISRRLGCARVGIGLARHEAVELKVLSDTAWIERNSALAQAYVAAMEEAYDNAAPIVVPPLVAAAERKEESPAPGVAPAPRHDALRAEHEASSVASVPLMLGVRCVGVLTLEWHGERLCTGEELAWLLAFAAMLPSIIEDKRRADQGALSKGADAGRQVATKIFGPRHLVWKAATAAIAITVAVLALVPVTYRVSAKTVIEGETQRVAAAPFEGFVAEAPVRAGDTVRSGQLLARLDDRDLKAELEKWNSERDQYERKVREALASREISTLQIAQAQFNQAEAQVKLASEKLRRSAITAPYDGVIVSGDLSQQIGAPVEQGKKLFEIAPLESYRVILQVDERDIRYVQARQEGELLIAGLTEDAMPFTVTKVTPVATTQDGRNFFRVEAKLLRADERLRPGMEGVGKVATRELRLWTVLTRSFTDWLRLQLWTWLP
ncbi:HlyD family efflux transporter periplasmic adaptor subunit [Ramlibacter sp. USB13]|uniref:HlyD family efflux transporter periplasmic adaptor subunit n=1 Tax=Ramlibacter cellulosilyticus TaxID=2764187 RepID=A0A923MPT9_9BURK|nr:HlyD family efflux transporter periplasmic adaptor subunit [Ramlibacter cellulosilyticus]MBC5782985.1 HlyD family efflux transporter periplasmic adaptor subunit [Ramlibacter cellulosilyticus]